MKPILNLLVTATIFICGLVLTLSIYPGFLQRIFLIVLAIAALWLAVAGSVAIQTIHHGIRGGQPFRAMAFRRAIAILLIVLSSYGLLKGYVPRRIAFSVSRPAFEQWLAEHPPQPEMHQPIDAILGIYKIDSYAVDPRGGIYFRSQHHGDGLGPDTVSYGFVYQPNFRE